jgi:hypothetical protein
MPLSRSRIAPQRRFLNGALVALVAAGALLAATLTEPGSSAAAVAPVAAPAAAAALADPCGSGGNAITCENSKAGSPSSEWDIDGAGDDTIQGFATDISVNVGSRIDFKIDTAASAYSITIYRSGYYNGDGARKIATLNPSATLPQHQPQCITDVSTELYDCGNWAVSGGWNVPSTAVSGVYFARLQITSGANAGDASHIPFIVRNDASTSAVVFQTSDTTWQAYNTYGGSSFYHGGDNGRAYKLSYNRPFATRGGSTAHDYYFANEYPLVRFLERNGYDVSYISGIDADRRGNLIKNHKVYLSVGHDEYWSAAQRANVEAARDAGVHLQFLSGNEMYWHVRWEPSADASHTAYRTLVSYKETWSNDKIDPTPEWTGTWRDPRFAPQSQGAGKPENAVTGTLYMANSDDLPVTVSAAEGKLRLWRNTSLASLQSGSAQLAQHTVGYESDEDLDNGFRPAGLIRMSTTVGPTPEYLTDFGNNVEPGTTTHHLTMYKAPSGALVFGAGSIQWTWGLDAEHDTPYAPEPADPRMQQAQVNLFADMGVQPATLMSGLVAATKTTDTVGPTVSISSPAAGATRANGAALTVSGTATDSGGGRVAAVEVSMDDGDTWHPATGTTSWTYTAVQHGLAAENIRVRAVDDSANIGTVATRAVNVTCPCSVFGAAVPKNPAANDSSAVELGLRFTPDVDGVIAGVRFYKGAGNGGTHTGRVWSSSGALLGTVTFSGESATGWQTATFASAVSVTAGQTYVVSYTSPQGHYAADENAFAMRELKAAPFTVAGGYGAPAAGVYGDPGTFPSSSFGNANYYVDPIFSTTDTSPLTVIGKAPLDGSSSVPRNAKVAATFSRSVSASTAVITVKDPSNVTVAGTTTYDAATRTATFTPSTALPGGVKFTATATAQDAQGIPVTGNNAWSFTTAVPQGAPGVCPCSLFSDELQPTLAEDSDTAAVTLGVRFTVDAPGTISAVRFYKSAGNTGSHTGALWNANGTQLATGTFTNESTSGWQTLTFSQPVSVTTGTTYVASYRTSVGRYSTATAFNAVDQSRSPLLVTANSGAYNYGTGFPSNISQANYMVDVVFNRLAPTIAITAQDPPPNALEVPRNNPVRVWFSSAIQPGATLTVTAGGTTLAGTTSLDTNGTRLSFVPSSSYPAGTVISVALAGVQSTDGANLANTSWSFTTNSANQAAAQTLFGDAVPQTASENDSAPVELGTAFSPSRNGVITALRFHKGAGNGGTHVGSLWSSTGTRLAQVTFTGETPTGWQRAALSTPVAVTAGQTYVVSYLAPQGHYSSTPHFFDTALTSGQLTAPAGNNGRYVYGAAGGFPTSSWGSTSYFVDVEFVPDAPTITVADRTPAAGATGVPVGVRPTITLSDPIAGGYSFTAKQGSTTVPGTVALSADAKKLTFTPSAALAADVDVTMTVSGVVSQEGAVLATQTWSFHTASGGGTSTILFDGLTPGIAAANDDGPLELGVSFTPSVNGEVTAVRFYKGAGNGGTHTGSLWSSTGVRLATGTFENETATGWQTLELDTPVAVTAGTAYVASYYAPQGHYALDMGFFGSAYTQGPLTVPSSGNGRFLYGAGGGFPTGSWNSSNYWVGVVFRVP